MKPPTGFSKYGRLAKWQAAHQQLLQDDAQYRKRHAASKLAVNCLLAIMLLFYLPFFGVHFFGPRADVWITIFIAAVIVGLNVRQLRYQTQRIQDFQSLKGDRP